MWWLVVLAMLPGSSPRHFPLWGPTFLRDSVERVPDHAAPLMRGTHRSALTLLQGAFGTRRLPLREAVESMPLSTRRSMVQSTMRLPLRDAVEKVPDAEGALMYSASDQSMMAVHKPGTSWWVNKQGGRFKPTSPSGLYGNKVTGSQKFKVVCFVEGWGVYRKEPMKFSVVRDLDPFSCTHLIYAFATLDPHYFVIIPQDDEYDIRKGGYRLLTAMKQANPALKVMISIGGWVEGTGKFSQMAGSAYHRREFIRSVIQFLDKHGFDGLDLDWEYPGATDLGGRPADKDHLALLVEELSEVFAPRGWQLSASVSPSRFRIEDGYDVPRLLKHLDFVNLMAFDLHAERDSSADHHAPLIQRKHDTGLNVFYNVDYSVRYWMKKGAPREKIVVGIPFYGRAFALLNASLSHPNSPVKGFGQEGRYTQEQGFLAYFEVLELLEDPRWKEFADDVGSPYAVNGDQWVGYDNPRSVATKMSYIKKNQLGGAMIWATDLDDFQGVYGDKYPLLSVVTKALLAGPSAPVEAGSSAPVLKPPVAGIPVFVEQDRSNCTGQGFARDPEDCAMYYRCEWSMKHTYVCPEGLHYHPELEMCNWPELAGCRVHPAAVEVASSTRSPITPPAFTCPSNGMFENPQDCRSYYVCDKGTAYKYVCGMGQWFNPQTGLCHYGSSERCSAKNLLQRQYFEDELIGEPSSMSTEGPSTSTTSAPWWSTTDQTTSTAGGWWTSSRPTTTTAPPNDWWTERPTEETTSHRPSDWWTPATSTLAPADAEKECTSGEYYADTQSCHSFFICVNHKLVRQTCAPGLVWNQEQSMCDWSFNVKCDQRQRQRQRIRPVSYSTADSSCQSGSYEYYQGDCKRYLMCLFGKYKEFSCASGLHWNNREHICDWPESAQCPEDVGDDIGGEVVTSAPTPPATYPSTTSPTTTTTAETRPPSGVQQSGYFKIVCYFTNWAWYRPGDGKYLPEDIDESLCTHIVYGFAVLDYENLIVKAHDSWADFDNKFYERVVAYKKKGLKVSLALGGWNDSAGDKYSRLVNSPSARRRFVQHVLEFLDKYGFDGLDLDWEYPKCWQVDCNKGPDSDKPAFAALLRELRQAFSPRGLLLSSAVSPSKNVVDAGYDVKTLGETLDWVAVMTYDYHGQWDKKTGHLAPLYFHEEDDFYHFNANFSINYWISQGVPRRKIVMGMPMYGQSFQLAQASTNGLNARAPGPGQAGEFTRAAGFLAYYEICDRIKNRGWKVVKDTKRRMGPYAFKGNQWFSFDDVEMIRIKSEYIRKMDLGGGMVWALDLDDFRNRCGEGYHPLLNTINSVLATPSEDGKEDTDVRPPMGPTRPSSPPSSTPESSLDMSTVPSVTTTNRPFVPTTTGGDFKVICYFTNWAWYRQGGGKYLPEDIPFELCTHIIYGFAVLNGDQLLIRPHDTWADYDNKFYERVAAFKQKGLKVLLAIGGWNDSAGDKYSRLVNNPSARARFVMHVLDFLEQHNFDGLDLDWEYPKCWQVDCKKGPDSDKPAFAALLKELKEAFQPKGLLLSSAVSPSRSVVNAGYDVPALSKYLDWISVMTYDFHGQWDKQTGHVAPMYPHPDDTDVTFNANFSIHYWINQGADRKKIVMGMPMYGQSFSLADTTDQGLNVPTYGGGEAGEATRARGFLAYYEICTNIQEKGWHVVKDPKGRMGPYAYLRDQWVSFDDTAMIRHKSEYIRAMGLGGGMIWALDLDDFRNKCSCEQYPLLRTINRVLRGYPGPGPNCDIAADGPKHEPEDTGVVVTSTTSTMTKPPDEEPDSVSMEVMESPDCGRSVLVSHPSDCSKYFLCQYGQPLEQRCPDGLLWNIDHCDWPESTVCSSGEVGGAAPTSTSTSTSTTELPHSSGMPEVTTATVTTTRRPSTPGTITQDTGYKVICYFTNWAWYRQGIGKYLPEDIDDTLCTHIAYGFAVLDGTALTIKPHDSWADIDNSFYKKLTDLKKKGVKVLIAIGGWNDSLGDKYSRLVNDPAARSKFVDHVVQFIEQHNFDGLDFDWEYPKCWQVDCNKGPDSDKKGFADLVRELSAAFKPRGLLLSSAVSPSKVVIDKGYDVPVLSQYFDWISVMTYDFHGHWDKQTGHVAPLNYFPGDTYDYFNANFSINYWIQNGADRRKIIMGMPMYGQSFSLADTKDNGLNAKSYGPGEAGQFTRAGGFLAYYEICYNVKNQGWTTVRDPEGRIGPYAYKGTQWVSYDDVSDIRRKSQFVKSLGLGGGMIWALDLDDFRDRCGCGKHPLLKTINHELRGLHAQTSDCT